MPDFKVKLSQIEPHLFSASKIGLEKESLRVDRAGNISQLEHPSELGAPLTHSFITTDYAEALMEFITPPVDSSAEALEHLELTQRYVYHRLKDEMLWTTSMPCVLNSEADIKIARYGNSNMGRLKHIYRRGLGVRYGKLMQIISGIHFNFSFSRHLWSGLYKANRSSLTIRQYGDQGYMDMLRNIQRYGWLIIYLLGASPVISKSFLKDVPGRLRKLDSDSFFEPYATSLRMGDIGYTNSKEGKSGFRISYNNLDEYVSNMRRAITTICPEYKRLGVCKNGDYQQLNGNILQIENEHYSSVRPKQILQRMEKPVDALQARGIRYIELRSPDINPFYPAGINMQQMYFLEVFMHFCLLQHSPNITTQEQQEINYNQTLVAHQGRKPGLKLQSQGHSVLLAEWANKLFDSLQLVAEKLDIANASKQYHSAVTHHLKLVKDSNLTPSAKILTEMTEKQESFLEFSLRKSYQHRDYFLSMPLSKHTSAAFTQMAKDSFRKQQIEERDKQSFPDFLKQYLGDDTKHSSDYTETCYKQLACI